MSKEKMRYSPEGTDPGAYWSISTNADHSGL